jgi:hypothetical protein
MLFREHYLKCKVGRIWKEFVVEERLDPIPSRYPRFKTVRQGKTFSGFSMEECAENVAAFLQSRSRVIADKSASLARDNDRLNSDSRHTTVSKELEPLSPFQVEAANVSKVS